MGKVKQEHFVPQCYLHMFSNNGKLNVYDKNKNEVRNNQLVENIAKQKAFYDFSDDEMERLKEVYPNLYVQYIEKYFSDIIEPNLKKCLETIHDNFIEENDDYTCLLSDDFKANLSLQMAYQFLRTQGFRKQIKFTYDENSPLIQKLIILDKGIINDLASFFYNKKWFININKTATPYYTSDNPVVILDINGGEISVDAINSKGIKNIYYPYSSSLSVTLLDENIYGKINDLKIQRNEVINKFEVDYLNAMQIRNSNNNVFFIGEQIDETLFNLVNFKLKDGIQGK